jgi:hypothetical protein
MLHCTQSKGQTFVQDSLATGSFPPAFLSALGAFVVHQFFEGVIAEKVIGYNYCNTLLAVTSWLNACMRYSSEFVQISAVTCFRSF